jgi:hypothetical protein
MAKAKGTARKAGKSTKALRRRLAAGQVALVVRDQKNPALQRIEDVVVPPVRAPKQKWSYKSRRFYGPFWSGSDLSEIKVVVQGNSGSWYFGDFFTGNPDAGYYGAPLFPGVLPSTAAPEAACLPGSYPNADGFSAMTFAVYEISYSARYGGSVRLRCRRVAATGYDLRAGANLWDCRGLELDFFVCPTPSVLNTLGSFRNLAVSCEFRYSGLIAYELPAKELGSTQAPPMALADPLEATAVAALRALAFALMRSATATDSLGAFAVGFLRALFPDILGGALVVDGVCIEDGEIAFHTHTPVPTVDISVTVAAGMQGGTIPFTDLDFDFGPAAFRLDISGVGIARDGSTVAGNSHSGEKIDNSLTNEVHRTPQLNVGRWTAEEVAALDIVTLRVTIAGKELDDITADDRFVPVTFDVTLDRAAIDAAAAVPTFGTITETQSMVSTPFVGGTESPLEQQVGLLVTFKTRLTT